MLLQDGFESFKVHVDHVLDQSIDNPLLLGLHIVDAEDLISNILFRHLVDVRNLKAVFVEQGDVEDLLQLIIVVIPDVSVCPLWSQECIALFPNSDGMGLDTGKVLQIFDCESVHVLITQVFLYCSQLFSKGKPVHYLSKRRCQFQVP